jgi:protocatechuate 3,4-dioxygenase beta subunit
MKQLKVFLFLAFLLAVSAPAANACSCVVGGTPCSDYWKASAVFVGTVINNSPTTYKLGDFENEGRLVRFTIEQPMRGIRGKEVEVRTGSGGGDCGYGFQLGGRYLVYAYEASGKLFTGICSRTRPLSEASEDLAYFRSLDTAKPGATISGEVKRVDQNAPFEERLKPVANVKIVIDGPSKHVDVVTDQKGNYRVSGLPPGAYKVRVELPEGLSIYNPEQEATLFDRGCAQVGFWVESDTRITGKVYDAQGQPAADVLMELVPTERQGNASPTFVRTDKEGRYEMKLLQPARYLFGVRIYGSAGASYVPFPRTYYPGVTDAAQATVINVVEGQRLELNDLILPQRLVEKLLNGVVLDANGRPVSGATVWLKENEYGDRDMPYRKETDAEGRFSFKVYEGFQYNLNAYLDSENSERKQAEHSLRISSTTEPIRLVLK